MRPEDDMISEFTNLAFLPACESAVVSLVYTPAPHAGLLAGFESSASIKSQEPATSRPGQTAPRQFTSSSIVRGPRQKAALLVDNDPQVAQALAVILGLRRIRLMTATSVAKAMEVLETFDNGIAVMIANLGPTGHALSLLTAQRHARHRAPVVVMKAAEDRRGWAAAVRAGAAAFVDCPVGPAELQLTIMRFCT